MNYETFNAPDERMPHDEESIRFHYDDHPHDCGHFLVAREADWTEGHGKPCREEWWGCQVCGKCFSERELKKLVTVITPLEGEAA